MKTLKIDTRHDILLVEALPPFEPSKTQELVKILANVGCKCIITDNTFKLTLLKRAYSKNHEKEKNHISK